MDDANREQIRRMMDERIRDLASQANLDVGTAAKMAELDTALKYIAASFIDFRGDMRTGFDGVHTRLDKINGRVTDHERQINTQSNRLTAVENTWNVLKLLIPILGAVGAALIIAQLTGGPQ